MPKSSVAKTALALSVITFFGAVIFLLIPMRYHYLTLGSAQVKITWATTKSQQVKGLSGRSNLKKDEGLLFVFSESAKEHCVWMKDMNFAIDVLWFDESKKIVESIDDLQPSTYPQTFCPKQNVRYMLEVNSGSIQKNQWKIGQQAAF